MLRRILMGAGITLALSLLAFGAWVTYFMLFKNEIVIGGTPPANAARQTYHLPTPLKLNLTSMVWHMAMEENIGRKQMDAIYAKSTQPEKNTHREQLNCEYQIFNQMLNNLETPIKTEEQLNAYYDLAINMDSFTIGAENIIHDCENYLPLKNDALENLTRIVFRSSVLKLEKDMRKWQSKYRPNWDFEKIEAKILKDKLMELAPSPTLR